MFDRKAEEQIYDDEIAVIRGEIWDNCQDWCYKCSVDFPENLTERVTKSCACGRTLGFIPKAGIVEYLKTLPDDEREAREKGLWLHLSGLVYKTFTKKEHLYDDFMIPTFWTKIESVDPHDARPTNWLFGAVSPEEIEIFGKPKNRIYWFTYVSGKGSVEDIVRTVKATRALYGYEEPYQVMLDKKFGTAAKMVSFDDPERRTWQSELEKAGIKRIKVSHSSPGDVELGHKVVKEYLKPQFSNLTKTARPGMLFAKDGCSGSDGPIRQMMMYQYDEKTQKADDQYKDWPDTVRYVALEQFSYRSPENDKKLTDTLKERMNFAKESRNLRLAYG